MIERTVKRLPAENGRSGWEAISKRAFPVRSLEGNVNADWLIVGAGFAGLSAARRLTQVRPGDQVVVLDAREVAVSTAGRNSGFMIDVPHNLSSGEYASAGADTARAEMAQNRFAIGFAAEIADEFGMSLETFNRSGKINAAATERGLKLNESFGKSLKANNEPHRYLDAAEMRELAGTSYYIGGLFTPGAVTIQPADYIRGLAGGLSSRVDIFENSPVTSLRRENGNWTAITPRGTVTAPKVILGVNGHIEDFGHYERRLMHIFAYASMTAPFPADGLGRRASGQDRWALLPADSMGATVRKFTTDGQARIAIRTKYTYETTITASPSRMEKMARAHLRSFEARFPGLSGVPFENTWSGRLCLSLNHVPAFGEIDEGLYSACCENGLGTVKSTLAGIMVVNLATGVNSPQLAEFMDNPLPSKLPPEPLAWIGINSVIRYQELRAGREG
ncbi:NAD(P)/FAD-dependent oxidoreductase [Phyllobacterium zundukense]|uniref:Oxidoreductase n=1 Tax=Phyllobacterium zundukense TaxID=1867719 RepID=A0A2N9VUR3_9HYPH|nr:FAD-binding oxidoreductase [Phyllobacterium zundukense]ATU95315.1 oxidoreductase [Phyllobacterium zundukense]PIO43231.1 oxidoreductase [Phyllobacterium zundukense]